MKLHAQAFDLAKRREQFELQRGNVLKGRLDAEGKPIEFRLTFEQWNAIWDDSGKYQERGRRRGQYCMARFNDLGHYEVGNVFIQLHSDNVAQGNARKAGTKARQGKTEDAKRRIGAGIRLAWASKPVVTCHCGRSGRGSNMTRYHFTNCKVAA